MLPRSPPGEGGERGVKKLKFLRIEQELLIEISYNDFGCGKEGAEQRLSVKWLKV